MVDAFLGKKYKLASSENFDEFMKALGESLSQIGLVHHVILIKNKLFRGNLYLFSSQTGHVGDAIIIFAL